MPDQPPINPYESPRTVDGPGSSPIWLNRARSRNPAYDQTAFPRPIQFEGKVVPGEYAQLRHTIVPEKAYFTIRDVAVVLGAIALNLIIIVKFFPTNPLLAVFLVTAATYLIFLLSPKSFQHPQAVFFRVVHTAVPAKGEITRGGVTMLHRNKSGSGFNDEKSFHPWDVLFLVEQLSDGGTKIPVPDSASIGARPMPLRLMLYTKCYPSDSNESGVSVASTTPFFGMLCFDSSLFPNLRDWVTFVEFLREHLTVERPGELSAEEIV